MCSVRKSSQISEERREQILCSQYNILPETKTFITSSGGNITSTQTFVYLGTTIHFSPRDTHDLQARLTKATKVMDALNFYWNSDEVEIWAKVHIYQACVLSVLLWGSENWALTETFEHRLEVFHHRSIRRILKIRMQRVKDERLTNEKIRSMFCNIRTIKDLICLRKLTFLQHLTTEWQPPSTILSSWMNSNRLKGRPRCTTRSTTLVLLKQLLPNHIAANGELRSWVPFTQYSTQWNKLILGELQPEDFHFHDHTHYNSANTLPPFLSSPPFAYAATRRTAPRAATPSSPMRDCCCATASPSLRASRRAGRCGPFSPGRAPTTTTNALSRDWP